MKRRYDEINSLLSTGVSLIIDASQYRYDELRSMAVAAQNQNATLILKNTKGLRFDELRSIVVAGGKQLVVEI